jgi:Kef-type K+ transport system membrane component KefB
MTAESAAETERLKKGQRQFMTGLALVMLAMVFGGGLAIVFTLLNQRPAAIVCGVVGIAVMAVGIFLQMAASKLLRTR